jgi:hypothetical protein
MLLWG